MQQGLKLVFATVGLGLLAACTSTTVAVDEDTSFPVPLVRKLPITVGLHLPDSLRHFVHEEDLGDDGTFAINIGDAQPTVFGNLFAGMFDTALLIDDPTHPAADVSGTLVPTITELQFSTPFQTRTDYFEVWIRYHFQLYNRDGDLHGEFDLTAYGKANTQNYGLNHTPPTLRAAALQACRDLMAAFTVEFIQQPVVQSWLRVELGGGRS